MSNPAENDLLKKKKKKKLEKKVRSVVLFPMRGLCYDNTYVLSCEYTYLFTLAF